MLDVLGLDLITFMQDDSEANDDSGDMSRRLKSWGNKIVEGQRQVANGKYILLKGRDCSMQ